MNNILPTYAKIIGMKISSALAYKLGYVISIVASLLFQVASPLIILIIFGAGGSFPGWNIAQMIVLTGVLAFVKGIGFMLFMGLFWKFHTYVQKGKLDVYLIRPLPFLLSIIMEMFDDEDIGQVVGGLLILLYGLWMLGSVPGSTGLFVLLMCLALLFYFGLSLVACALTIYFVRTPRLYESLDILITFAGYPKTMYSRTASTVVGGIFPILVAAHYPASALLGFSLEGLPLAIISVCIILLIGIVSYYQSMNYYTSAGG